MKIIKLAPSQHREGRWLVWLDDGSLLRVSQNEVIDFSLYQGMELSPDQLAALVSTAEESTMKSKALDRAFSTPIGQEIYDQLLDQMEEGDHE